MAIWDRIVRMCHGDGNDSSASDTAEEDHRNHVKYKFSSKSKERLHTAHPKLGAVFNEVIKHVDCTIIEGVRTEERQKELLKQGKTRTLNSKHLVQSDGWSHAVDAIAYPIRWHDGPRNYMFAGFVKGIAASMGIKIRAGADWKGDFRLKGQTFNDLVHFELEDE